MIFLFRALNVIFLLKIFVAVAIRICCLEWKLLFLIVRLLNSFKIFFLNFFFLSKAGWWRARTIHLTVTRFANNKSKITSYSKASSSVIFQTLNVLRLCSIRCLQNLTFTICKNCKIATNFDISKDCILNLCGSL